MPKMSKHHHRAHTAFLDVHPDFEPTKVYEAFCKLMKLTDEAVERGLGKLFREGKIKPKAPKVKKPKRSSRPAASDDFR